MRHERINYITVGLFVLTMLGVLTYGLFRITGQTGPADHYYVYYRNVTGLKFGTPVYYEGFHIGQVESIEPEFREGQTLFRVDLSIQQGWKIPEDSTARMLASGLLAAMSIDIRAGRSSHPLKPGSRIAGREAADLMGAMQEVAGEIKSLSDEAIRPLLRNMNTHLETLATQLESRLPGIMENIEQLSRRLLVSAGRMEHLLRQENLDRVDHTLEEVATTAATFRALAQDLGRTRGRLDTLLANADRVVGHTDQVVGKAGAMLEKSTALVHENRPDVRAGVRDLRKSLGIVAARLDGILYNLDGTTRNLKEFSRTIRNNPSSLISSDRPKDPVGGRP